MQTERLEITGMTCSGCTGKVTRALEELDGVSDVNVSLDAGEATVQFDERLASFEQLESAVKRAGYGVGGAHAIHSHQGKSGCC